ncbi:hypothetical protein Tco_1336925 [Tanacetum coccineum]
MMLQNQSEMGEGLAMPTDPYYTPTILQLSSQPQKKQKPRKPKRKDIKVPQPSDPTKNVADEVVHKELGDSLVRAATTASSLGAEHDSGNIFKTQSKATPNESSSLGTNSGGGPGGNTLRSDEDRIKHDELMALCTNLENKVLDLEKTNTTQQKEIASLKRRAKKLEKRTRSRTHGLKRLYKVGLTARVESFGDEQSLGEDASKQGRISAIDADEDITLVSVQDDADKEMFDVNVLDCDEVFVAEQNENVVDAQVSTDVTTFTINTEEITLAQALEAFKTSKPKVKGIIFQEPSKSTTITTISSQPSQDKGKGIMIEEPMKPKKKYQIRLNEETALKLQAEFDEEERLAREKVEKEQDANIALIETWDDIQAKIDVDHELAERMQAQEQEELSITEKGYKLKDLKLKEFDSIQEMFDRAFKRVNTFKDFRTELVESKEKRVREELIQESTKKQKVEDDKETTELKQFMEIIPDEEEVTIDVIPLAVKSPKIVDWKIHKEGKKSYYQIVRADGKSQIPVEDLDLLLWGDLKTMFETHIEDEVWKKQQGYKVLSWKLYDSCRVHSLMMQSMQIYMLVEKTYPLTPPTLSMMLEKKLEIYYQSKMAYQLCKLIKKQLKNYIQGVCGALDGAVNISGPSGELDRMPTLSDVEI